MGIHLPPKTGCKVRVLRRFALEETAVHGSLVRVVGKGNTRGGMRSFRPSNSCIPLREEDTFPPWVLVCSEPRIYRGFPSWFRDWGFPPSNRGRSSPVQGILSSSSRGPCPFCRGRLWGWRTPAPRRTVAVEGAAPDVWFGPLAIRLHPAAVRWRVVVVSSWSGRLLRKPNTIELAISTHLKNLSDSTNIYCILTSALPMQSECLVTSTFTKGKRSVRLTIITTRVRSTMGR